LSGELAFIEKLRALAHTPAARGLDDDAAVLEVGGETLVLTHDMMVEGVHFLDSQDAADVAWKLVAVNLSDLAAKGAQPLGVLLGYTLGPDDAAFLRGLEDILATYDVPLLGGDTVSGGPPRSLGLTAIGRATHIPPPSRSGARAGDEVWITGAVGGAMLGFEALRDGSGADSAAYRRPRPLLAEGQALAPQVTAMMDVSDGVLIDSQRIAIASKVTIALDTASVPIAVPETRRDDALRWGDDYQLLFTLPAGTTPAVPATRIGRVRLDKGPPLLLDGYPPPAGEILGFTHRSAD
jgi:thiamine-monophosphate kinase